MSLPAFAQLESRITQQCLGAFFNARLLVNGTHWVQVSGALAFG